LYSHQKVTEVLNSYFNTTAKHINSFKKFVKIMLFTVLFNFFFKTKLRSFLTFYFIITMIFCTPMRNLVIGIIITAYNLVFNPLTLVATAISSNLLNFFFNYININGLLNSLNYVIFLFNYVWFFHLYKFFFVFWYVIILFYKFDYGQWRGATRKQLKEWGIWLYTESPFSFFRLEKNLIKRNKKAQE
jgi:hypothetical protein